MVKLNSLRTSFLFFVTMTIFVLAYTIKVDIDSNNARELALLEVAKLANKSIKTVNTEHLKCLATNIYHEARSEPFMGQVAVARVVMNRIKHGFASNPCRVVYQYTTVPDLNSEDGTKKLCQFSWVCEGKSTPNSNNPMYKQAEYIANKVLAENKWNDIVPSNVLFFHNHSVNPNWNHHKFMVIGNHIFYSKNNK